MSKCAYCGHETNKSEGQIVYWCDKIKPNTIKREIFTVREASPVTITPLPCTLTQDPADDRGMAE